MVNIIWFIYIIILMLAVGLRIKRLLNLPMQGIAEKVVFSLSMGLAVLSYLTFTVGVLGLLYRGIMYFILIISSLFLLPEIKKIAVNIAQSLNRVSRYRISENKEAFLFLSLFFIFAVTTLIEAFAPVINLDCLSYHLALPKIYIKQHRISSIPFIIASNWPAAIDMPYLFGLLVQSDVLSQLFSWLMTATLVFSVYALGKRYFSYRVGLLGGLVFYSIPLVNVYAAVTYVDLGTVLFIMLTAYAFINWLNTAQKPWLIVSAINCGMAAWSKLHGLFTIPLLGLGILFFRLKKKDSFKVIVKDVFVVFAISSVIAAPWYIKTWIATGNPVFHFMYNIFGGKNWNALSDSIHASLLSALRIKNIGDFVLLPLNWALGTYDASIGPLILVLAAVALFRIRTADKNIKVILTIALLFFIIFGLITTQPRFSFVVFALCSIVAAYELDRIWPRGKILGAGLVVFLCLLTIAWNLKVERGKFLAAIGKIKRDDFLRQSTPFYEQYQWMNKNTPQNSKILIWSVHTYYLDREYVWALPIQGLIDYSKVQDAKSMLARMQELKITHLFFVPHERITVAAMGDFLDKLHGELLKTKKLIAVKKWHSGELLSNGKVIDTVLYRVNY